MKWLLISLAIGLAACDKLDRTYLPPPGAQFAGGTLGHHDAPLAPPHHTHPGQESTIGGQKGQSNYGINGDNVNFGDKIPKVPVTTTSYAYSQTTTYPPGQGYETTVLPINPVTGLPVESHQGNYPQGTTQGQTSNVGTNFQPGYVPQGTTPAPTNYGSTGYDQFANQPIGQFPQNVITPGGTAQTPGSTYPGQNQGQFEYPGQVNAEQQGLVPTGAPINQLFNHNPGQNVVTPGSVAQIPGREQGLVQYPGGQSGQQGFIPITGSPINLQPSGNQYGVNYDGLGPISQGAHTSQPTNVQNIGGTQPTQASFQYQKPITIGGSPSPYPTGNQNYGPSVPTGSENLYQPGSTPTNPSYYNGVSSSTPYPDVPSSTSAYSPMGPIYRPERPQAAADRNAVILNYENIRTPNGYSYSFDTSNGIHADESGIVDNGTKAQGAYSYIGDDGKVYSVIYTADENGFQPRGDHLPTPPPIPEAIKKVIEQAAKDKAAGIVHDGSYDEAKYGDKGYQSTESRRRPQNKNAGRDDIVKPVIGIKDFEYDKDIAQDQFHHNLPITGTRKNGKVPTRPPSNEIIGENNDEDISDGNTRLVGDKYSPKKVYDANSAPIVQGGINQQSIYLTKQSTSGRRPVSNGVDLPFIESEDTNRNSRPGSKNRKPFERRPVYSGGKHESETKYPDSHENVDGTDYYGDEFDEIEGQHIESGSANISAEPGDNINTNFDSVTGAPVIGNKKKILRQRIKSNRRPGVTGNRYNQHRDSRPRQQMTEQDEPGYDYQQPNTNFEQNTFPTRFNSQVVSSTKKPDQHRSEYIEGTTRKPFMTPNVYNQKNKNGQTTPSKYNQKDLNNQSTTRRPFTTVGVTSPSGNSYTDYDDGDDYATDLNIGDDRIDSTKTPGEKNDITSRPFQSTHTTSRPQYVSDGQKPRVNQKGTVTSGQRTDQSPDYTYGSTTPMPSHNSRFGSTEIPRRLKPQQYRPSTSIPDSTTTVGRPITSQPPSGNRQSDFNYQTTRPASKYPGNNVGPGYPTTGTFPSRGSTTPGLGVSTPQDYYTSTYGPTQDYGTSTVSPTSGYTQGPGSPFPTRTPGTQSTLDETFHTGYHYGPPKSGSFHHDKISGPGIFTPTGNLGDTYPTAPAGTYYQGPGVFPSTTVVPIIPGRQGSFIPSQSGNTGPQSSPFGTYQGNYQNGPSTPDYATTIVSSTPGGKQDFDYTGPHQGTTGYEYGTTKPTYYPTNSPSGSFIPTGTTPSPGYTTTYRPGFHSTKDTFVGGPVDRYGRPITTEQGGSHPGFGPTQGTTEPINNVGPNLYGTDQSTTYPGGYEPNRVIGEDFSGPKQPQRYDPQTGYHYK